MITTVLVAVGFGVVLAGPAVAQISATESEDPSPIARDALDETRDLIAEGRAIAALNCSSCHAIAGPGPSPVGDAPAFSTFAEQWPIEYLAEAFAEGIVVGHPTVAMPRFTFSPEEIDALLAYLESVQTSIEGDEPVLGDPARGEDLAGELCARCHRALPDEQSALGSGAVAFWDLAADPRRGTTFLREFMSQSHPFMPFDQLTPQDREDIIAYMRSLAEER